MSAAFSPQQRALPKLTISKEEDTGGYDSDGALGHFSNVLDTESDQDFDKDSRPSVEPIVIDEENNKEDVAPYSYQGCNNKKIEIG